MIDLLKEAALMGVVGSVGATILIFIFNIIRRAL